MFKSRIVYLGILFFGFAYTFLLAVTLPVSFKELAWFFWASSLLSLPILLIGYLIEYFLSVYPEIQLNKAQGLLKKDDQSPLTTPVVYVVFMIFITTVSGFASVILGVFLSIIAPIEPDRYFSVDGYTKNFSLAFLLYLSKKYIIFLPAFFALKSSLFYVGPINRVRGYGYVRDAGLALASCFLAIVVGLACKSSIPQNSLSLIQVVIFLIPMFLPWAFIAGKDVLSKRYNKLPELSVPIVLPVEYIYRTNQKFWGGVILFSAILMLILFLKLMTIIWGMSAYQFIGKLLLSFFIGGIGLAVASGFTFAAMNMLFGFKKIILSSSGVEYHEHGYLVIFPKDKIFKILWSEYKTIEQQREFWTGGSTTSSSHYRYVILLKHNKDKTKNVQLYVAYHESGWERRAEQWSKLLSIPIYKSEKTI